VTGDERRPLASAQSEYRERTVDPKSQDDLLAAYETTAERWSSLQSNAGAANAVFDENHRLYKLLRVEPDGRDGIAKLMSHRDVGVKLVAAAHTLGWNPADASEVLEAIEQGPGLHAVTAKYTLRSYRSGTLDQDW
jgi:hypothetical protein